MALAYVGRFATSEAKLRRYLDRKLRERGWDGDGPATDAVGAILARFVGHGYLNDADYARMRGATLARRGLGPRRVRAQLAADGIGADRAAPVLAEATDGALATALAFARRRRLGPFAKEAVADTRAREKAFAAFLRAGHDASVARRILAVTPGDDVALAELDEAIEAG